jgi:sugar lactone lactonase YvrE
MKHTIFLLAALAFAPQVSAASWPSREDTRLIPVCHADHVWNAVTTTAGGRIFVGFPGGNFPGRQLAEVTGPASSRPYPNAAWNAWKPGLSPAHAFVHVNAIRIGPDGKLWVVDAGSPGFGKPAIPGGARAIRIDPTTNRVDRIFDLRAAVTPVSYLDDIRFNGSRAYLTDAGDPGLLVLDLASGAVRRVLDHDPTTIARRPMRADGKILRDQQGAELRLNADQLEVSPDGSVLYYQPACGPLARIETKWLDDPHVPPAELARHARVWLDTPTSGGTAIAADGTVYYGDADHRSILKIAPDGKITTLITDPRLIWSDAMWIDRDGYLWIPATQQNLTAGFNDGKDDVHFPVWIDKMQIHAKPPRLDHP